MRARGDFLRFFKPTFGDADLERRTIQLVFDENGRLPAYASDVNLDPIGKGLGMQIVYQIQPVVDTRDLEITYIDPLLWGLSQLQPLPETLNTGQSQDSGASGFDLKGTPVAAGQRTLEMRKIGRKKYSTGLSQWLQDSAEAGFIGHSADCPLSRWERVGVRGQN